MTYKKCELNDVPATVRFDVPRRNQGQMVEIAYGGFERAEHDEGAPFKRVTDRSEQTTTYYRAVTR